MAFSVIEKALAQVNYTLADVVRTRVYLSDEADMDAVGKAHGELFASIRPAAISTSTRSATSGAMR